MRQNFILKIGIIQQMELRYLFMVLPLIIASIGFTQGINIKFEHLGKNSGLSNNNVSSILQDSRGFMWFGTSDGLNKYDGYQFTSYKTNPLNGNSISNNSIKSVIEDTKENIWVGTWGGGLNKFVRKTNTFIHFKNEQGNKNSISSDLVTCLLDDKQGSIWIGTGDGGLDLFDAENNKFVHCILPHDSTGLRNDYVTNLFKDSEHNLWIGAISSGLHLFNRNNGVLKHFQHIDKDEKSLCDNDVNVIFEDSRNNLWIGTNNGGLDLMNRKTGTFSHLKNNILSGNKFSHYGIISIGEGNNGKLWIGTRDGGLNIFDPGTATSRNYFHDELDITSISRNTVPAIYKDSKGNIWIGTLAGGINFVNSAGNAFIHYDHNASKNSLSDNNVTGIYEDSDKNLWIGTDGGGLNLFDRKSGRFTYYKHRVNNKNSICSDNILAICEDGSGNLWIGTWGEGITVFNKKRNTFKHFKNDAANAGSLGSNNVWTIFKDREKNIWIGTYGNGLNLYNQADNSFTHYEYDINKPSGINSNQVMAIFEDSKGFLWIGTDGGGLNEFDRNSKKFTHYTHNDSSNSLSYNFVSDILEDQKGNLYIASGTGLNYFNTATHHFTVYTSKDDFKDDAASGMMQDVKGNLWISRAKGISCFNPLTTSFINFNIDDGLHPNMYQTRAYCKSQSGMMYFGGINGFDEFFPDSIKKTSFDPKLVITNFQIFNTDVPVALNERDPSPLKNDIAETKSITIPYSSSVISFEFASLHYGVQDRKQYAYMLEGFDKRWNEVGTKRIATYTNLDPGKYVFKVKGLNNEGKWSPGIKSIRLTITPPFWLTWWFKSAVLIFIIGTGLGFYKFRVNIIKVQKRRLEQMVKEQTKELITSGKEEHLARQGAERANKHLERKNKELEQFAFIASHDLQEPLRTTSSFVALLHKQYQGKLLDEKANTYITHALEASERMKVLINNLLDFSILGNKKELERIECDKALHAVVADLGIAISDAKADIQYGYLPVIYGYSTELNQLFQNLISNAIKFRKTEIPLIINISAQKKHDFWEFAFKDNGIGIDEEHNEKIFLIFQRLHNRTEYAGSGIGLAHCKKIVELHNGEIWVESILGEGSTFYFTLPDGHTIIPQKQ